MTTDYRKMWEDLNIDMKNHTKIFIPPEPQRIGALGAALEALEVILEN